MSEEIKAWLDSVFAAGVNNKLTVGETVKLVINNSSFKKPSETFAVRVSQLESCLSGITGMPPKRWARRPHFYTYNEIIAAKRT